MCLLFAKVIYWMVTGCDVNLDGTYLDATKWCHTATPTELRVAGEIFEVIEQSTLPKMQTT